MDGHSREPLNNVNRYDVPFQSGDALKATDGLVIDIVLVPLKLGWRVASSANTSVGRMYSILVLK